MEKLSFYYKKREKEVGEINPLPRNI